MINIIEHKHKLILNTWKMIIEKGKFIGWEYNFICLECDYIYTDGRYFINEKPQCSYENIFTDKVEIESKINEVAEKVINNGNNDREISSKNV